MTGEPVSRTATFEDDEDVAYFENPRDGVIVVVTPDPENPGGVCIHCHGDNDHFKDDGGCAHIEEFLGVQKPSSSPMRVLPFRGWGSREAMERGEAMES